MNKQEHDQFLHDRVMDMLKQKDEREAAPPPIPEVKSKGFIKSLSLKLKQVFKRR
jgi:hypothetical protein